MGLGPEMWRTRAWRCPLHNLQTSNLSCAGTHAHALMKPDPIPLQFGTHGESGPRELTGSGNLFEQGKSDVFKFKMPDLGE